MKLVILFILGFPLYISYFKYFILLNIHIHTQFEDITWNEEGMSNTSKFIILSFHLFVSRYQRRKERQSDVVLVSTPHHQYIIIQLLLTIITKIGFQE